MKEATNISHLENPKKSWLNSPGPSDLAVVYHEADKSGPHLDVHIPSYGTSIGINLARKTIDGKPVPEALKYNSKGNLTEISKEKLFNILKAEMSNKSRLFSNFDHNIGEATMEWPVGGSPVGYGSGKTRQVIHQSKLHVHRSGDNTAIVYAPGINPSQRLYMYRLGHGPKQTIIAGPTDTVTPVFQDRLHLKNVQEDKLSGADIITKKYDSASAYIDIGKKGTRLFSPRQSVSTGRLIEYTGKVPSISAFKHDSNIKGMGELLFKRDGKYLPAHIAGGILNKNDLPPSGVTPEFRMYRVDTVDGKDVSQEDYKDNLKRLNDIAMIGIGHGIHAPEITTVDQARKLGLEGVVGVKRGMSIVSGGMKHKFKADPNDWELQSINFRPGDKGGIAGIATFKSLDSGKIFNMGPAAIGKHSYVKDMMANPEKYLRKVYKVNSNVGHEGRSSKIIEEHMDKGVS